MVRYILCCKCDGMPKFTKDAFSLLKPGEPTPVIYSGKDEIYKLVNSLNDGNFKNYASALAKNKDKYAYLFEVADNGDIVTQYNLKTGAKIC